MTLIYFVIILGIIIFIHELGHFLFAKLFGVYVYEFSLGMGPKLWGKKGKNGETEYCLRAIPIGGFVQLAGEEIDDDKKISKDRKLYSKPVWQRLLIMFFGAGNNFILAFLMLFVVALAWGAPSMDPILNNVKVDYPMYDAGIRNGDRVLSVNGKKTSTLDDIQIYVTLANDGSGTGVTFEIEDAAGVVKTIVVVPVEEKDEDTDESRYIFGVTFTQQTEKGFVASIKYAFTKMGALFKQMVIVLKSLFTGNLGVDSLSGPVGIYSIVGETKEAGFASVLQLIALLSINVGFINLIPFPAFDGGRILFLIIEKIKGSPVSPKIENIFHTIGFILLMILIIYITFNDIFRLIK